MMILIDADEVAAGIICPSYLFYFMCVRVLFFYVPVLHSIIISTAGLDEETTSTNLH